MKDFWQKHGDQIFLGALFVYVVILAIGTVGVAFDIQWILDFF